MDSRSRRQFLKVAGAASIVGVFPSARAAHRASPYVAGRIPVPFSLGVASYSFRAFTLDQAIAMTVRLGLAKMTLKDMHLPLTSSQEEVDRVILRMSAAGIQLSSCGVVYMTSVSEIDRAFAYAARAHLSMLVGVPDQSLLTYAEQKGKETGIRLAIHNHGPTDQRYPSPESAYRLIERMDPNMGLCIDVGHTARLGIDPAKDVERFFDRLFDVHIKDVSSPDAKGTTVEIGRGVVDIPLLVSTLTKLKYSSALHFEFEKDQNDPLPGLAESIGYVRGVFAALP